MKKTLTEVKEEIGGIISTNNFIGDRLKALSGAGYPIKYAYIKTGGLGSITYLKKKRIYRIQVAYGELKKGYPASWVTDVYERDLLSTEVEQPF